MVTRAPAIRAQIAARPEPPFHRLFDPLTHQVVQGGPLARERFGARWADRDDLVALAQAKRSALPPALAEALRETHRRLGASPQSLASLEQLARGEAVCAVAGQQPALLGGPLYAFHKTAAAVGLARRVAARTRVPCVPVFWIHVEDSDFDEIRSVTLGDAALNLHELMLPPTAHPEGGLVGSIPLAPVLPLGAAALSHWSSLPAQPEVARLWERCTALAADLGALHGALVLALFAHQGVVVIDPRLPAFRAAARPWIDRYLGRAEECSSAARRAGAMLESRLGKRPLADASLDSFVFAVDERSRRKVSVAEASSLGASADLSPSVALRPVIQDAVLPTVAMACGPGELAYLAQLREVYALLSVTAACPVPRLGATWLPPAAVALLEASGGDPWELVAATDAVLRREADRRVPEETRAEVARMRAESLAALARVASLTARFDPSLAQIVESARGKIDFQWSRIADGLVAKARHRLEREHPEWGRLRPYLLPGDRLQERRLASLEPVAHRGLAVVTELGDLAEAHAEGLERGAHPHYLLEL